MSHLCHNDFDVHKDSDKRLRNAKIAETFWIFTAKIGLLSILVLYDSVSVFSAFCHYFVCSICTVPTDALGLVFVNSFLYQIYKSRKPRRLKKTAMHSYCVSTAIPLMRLSEVPHLRACREALCQIVRCFLIQM